MEKRIPMNTESLQENFSNVYRNFYSRNDLVLSGCFNIPWWSSSLWHRSNHLRIRSKIPLKCYIWIKKTKNRDVKIKDVIFYNIVKKNFEAYNFIKVNKEADKVIRLLSEIITKKDLDGWIEIEILSETTRWHSLWFSWTSFSLIVAAIYILSWKLSINELKDYENFITSDIFKNIFIESWKLDFISRYWNTIWENILNTLYNKKEPSYFYTESFSGDIDVDKLDDIYYEYSSIPQKYKENIITSDLPIDYCLVFTWIPTDTKQVEQYKKWDLKEFEKYKEFIQQDLISEKNRNKNLYVNRFIWDEPIYGNFINILSILSVKTIELFKKLYENWDSKTYVEELIWHINDCKSAISLVEDQSSFAEDFTYAFRKNKNNSEEMVWIMPAYSWKIWWWYLIVTKSSISRETMGQTIVELRNSYPNIEIEYCSYLDWECSDWIKIEQFISEKIFSSYIDKDKLICTNNKNESYIWNYNEIINNEKEWILLDLINWKISINWEKLTSKDIPSQNTTIELLINLLNNIDKEISNKELMSSTYSKNKNEMLWKIVMPFVKIVEDKTWEKISLICKWSLTDFYLKLDKSDVKISIVKKP
ncbi:MAG: hypothetical protein ACD_3C00145G0013 [uncultured bacterium (gcode 4)]|uniref:Uncharacterized protein n=1 Tax=uncultured bacterium (gcode 4) TaxID=1234023 RepID=K2G0W7_9BACT|nr:MAG: hypothetical protein ACD_3C00145G0013 [uncultured bacterium (gcode 4)]